MKKLLFCIALLVSETGLFGQIAPPIVYLGFKGEFITPQEGFRAALLLTPEQNAALKEAWDEACPVILPIKQLGPAATAEQRKQYSDTLNAFYAKRDTILTQDQIDIRTTISDVLLRISKSVKLDFSPRIDAATTPEERKSIIAEMEDARRKLMIQELQAAIPPKNMAALLAVQKM